LDSLSLLPCEALIQPRMAANSVPVLRSQNSAAVRNLISSRNIKSPLFYGLTTTRSETNCANEK
jgi:hypothetical protein